MNATVCVMRCPHGAYAISFDIGSTATRVFGHKHCGTWDDVATWGVSADDVRELINQCEALIHDIDKAAAASTEPAP